VPFYILEVSVENINVGSFFLFFTKEWLSLQEQRVTRTELGSQPAPVVTLDPVLTTIVLHSIKQNQLSQRLDLHQDVQTLVQQEVA